MCTLRIDDPHWSSSGESVTQKNNVHCQATAEVKVDMELHFISSGSPGSPVEGPGESVMSESETRTIQAGQDMVFQVPLPGGAKVTDEGTYYGSTTATVVENGDSETGKSRHRFITPN